jgi:carbon storage regulator
MLVLSRKKTQRIFIGDDIVITLVRVSGESCRLGIEAPPGMKVQREEVAVAADQHLADGRLGP